MLGSFERKEMKGVKEIQQQYWRIDYKLFLDVVKLRIHKMKQSLHNAHVENVTLYVCESCVDAENRNPTCDPGFPETSFFVLVFPAAVSAPPILSPFSVAAILSASGMRGQVDRV